jgi:hypothetical protein
MDYYEGRDNKKTAREQTAYWKKCRKEKRVAIFVYEKGSVNSVVRWNADSIFGKPIIENDKKAFEQLVHIIAKCCGENYHGGLGALYGYLTMASEDAKCFAKELRVFLDNIIIEIV